MSAARSIIVPAAGLSEKSVRAELALDRATLHALMPELGAPHDYSWPPQALGYVFTADGVRRLVTLTHSDLDVIEETPTPAPAPEPGAHRPHHHGDRANGYQPEPEE